MADPLIKADPDAKVGSPANFADEDIYEDAGDLEFNADPMYQQLYLARVPKYLWDLWSKLDDDAEIEIGTVRQTHHTQNGQQRTKLQMLLRSDLAQHQNVPKEYDLDITAEKVDNTFIFTEKDLPGFKSKSQIPFDPEMANMPARLTRPKFPRGSPDKTPWKVNKTYQPYFRRAIPKKTTLAGRVAHEVNCIAVTNPESERLLAQRTIEAMRPKAGTIFLQGDNTKLANGFIEPGTMSAMGAFGGFIKNTPISSKKASQDIKNARMPQNELLDLIFQSFRKYNYWSMKALRAELRQPEAYIRETLEKIADLPKSGKFAMHWTLKPEYKDATYVNATNTIAPGGMPGTDGVEDSDMGDGTGEEEEDEDVKFEDAMPL